MSRISPKCERGVVNPSATWALRGALEVRVANENVFGLCNRNI